MQEVLTANSLEQYKDAFNAAGLTSFDYFLSISPDEVDQILTNIKMLRGHIFKFKMIIDEMKSKSVPKSAASFPAISAAVNPSPMEVQTVNTESTRTPHIDHSMIAEETCIVHHVSDVQTELNSVKGLYNSSLPESSTILNICHINNGHNTEIMNEIPSKGDACVENSVAACSIVEKNVSVRETAIKVVQLQGQLDYIVQFKQGIVQALAQFAEFDFSSYIQSLRDLRTMQESINGLLSVDAEMSS